MYKAYLNCIATAVPDYDVHQRFIEFAPTLLRNQRDRTLFKRMVGRSQIAHRYSYFQPHSDPSLLDAENFYLSEAFPNTKCRMKFYEQHAFSLAQQALDQLNLQGGDGITHLIVTSCTGFYAPGLDLQIIERYELSPSVERTFIGFMGCYAAINALKLARHIVRSEPKARILIVNLELCTLHLQNTGKLEDILSFLIFADGCAASVVSAEQTGLCLENFHALILSDSSDHITWHVGDSGFDMNLSGQVPAKVLANLPHSLPQITGGLTVEEIQYWAVHPGGRSILDAVEEGAKLPKRALDYSRRVLHDFGNMSSASIMFVLRDILQQEQQPGLGCAMAFGPGITIESMLFKIGI